MNAVLATFSAIILSYIGSVYVLGHQQKCVENSNVSHLVYTGQNTVCIGLGPDLQNIFRFIIRLLELCRKINLR